MSLARTSRVISHARRTMSWVGAILGGEEISPEQCNYVDTGIGSTSTPGSFPSSCSPYGCYDMNGNEWEWMRNVSFPRYPYPLDELSWEKEEGKRSRVLRGGSFVGDDRDVRCAIR